ncbi:mucin-17-like [Saccostrea echinata]|uniref:mucin-17-like n=1 Tax=Saccostrea echinata TaxID=191078 RepID=UPI002A810247|nr:mucin-17-like [Saccostrea echinata]
MYIVKTVTILCSLWTTPLVFGTKQEIFPQSAYRTWEDAESSCRKDGLGLLVNVDKLTSSSLTELEDSITDPDPYWTGAYRLSMFYWNFGCYTIDSVAMYLKNLNQNETANSVVHCAVFCGEKRDWIGLMKGFCYCLDIVSQVSLEVSQCTIPCPGHKRDACGDEQAMSVYKLLNETEIADDIAKEQLKDNQLCTYLEINAGRIAWKVDDCSQQKMVLCQNRTDTGTEFRNPHYTRKDWDTAHQDCRDKKLEMAVITRNDTNKPPFNRLSPSTKIDVWIALYRHVLDRWTDIDMKDNPQNCLAIEKNNFGVLDRTWQPCSTQNKYVCLSEGASPTVESAVIGTPSPTTVSTGRTKQTTPTIPKSTILTEKTAKQTIISTTEQTPTAEGTTTQLIPSTKFKIQRTTMPITPQIILTIKRNRTQQATIPTTQQTIPAAKETTQIIQTTKVTTQQTTFPTTVETTPQTIPTTKGTTQQTSTPTTFPPIEVTTSQTTPTIKRTTQQTTAKTNIPTTEVTTPQTIPTTKITTQETKLPTTEQTTIPSTEVTSKLFPTTDEPTQYTTTPAAAEQTTFPTTELTTTQTTLSTTQESTIPIKELETTFTGEKQTFPTAVKLTKVISTEQTTSVSTSVPTTKQINFPSTGQQTSIPTTQMNTKMSTTQYTTLFSLELNTVLETEQTFSMATKRIPTELARGSTELTKAAGSPSTEIFHTTELLSKATDSVTTMTKVTQRKTTEEDTTKRKLTVSHKHTTSSGNASDTLEPNPERSSEQVSKIPTTELIVVIVIFVAVLLLAVFVFLQWFIRKRRKSVTLNRRTSTEITFKGEEEMLIRSYSGKSANLSPKPLPRIDIDKGSLQALSNIPDSHKNLNQSKETLDIPWIDASRNTLDDISFSLDTEPRSENIGAKSQSAPELDRIGDDSEDDDDSTFMKTFSQKHQPIESEI